MKYKKNKNGYVYKFYGWGDDYSGLAQGVSPCEMLPG